MSERFVVAVDGHALLDGEAARAVALDAALQQLERALPVHHVAIADARTLQVCVLWERCGSAPSYRLVGALRGWL